MTENKKWENLSKIKEQINENKNVFEKDPITADTKFHFAELGREETASTTIQH